MAWRCLLYVDLDTFDPRPKAAPAADLRLLLLYGVCLQGVQGGTGPSSARHINSWSLFGWMFADKISNEFDILAIRPSGWNFIDP